MNKKAVSFGAFLITVLLVCGVGYVGYVIYDFIKIENIQKISLPNEFVEILNSRYIESGEKEFVYCLNGVIDENTAVITNYEEAEIIGESIEDYSIQVKCPFNSIGTIHNHPSGICSLSDVDSYTFGNSRHEIIGIICNFEDIHFYSPSSLANSIEIIIV